MLDIGVWNFIWPIINIILLFILLKIFLFKPLRKMMDERTASIQNDIDSAEKAKLEARELAEANRETLAQARKEAQNIIEQAKQEAASVKSELLKSSQEEAKQLIDSANKNIAVERQKALQEAQSQIADLAIAAASKIVGENLGDENNRRLVDNFLEEENKKLSGDDLLNEVH
ncbi:MAG: F0F1 ATP synthase subunit B [Ruminococcus sp.]|nr:F0F1 ATP synthase subunit B [Ruminococcus sp.]